MRVSESVVSECIGFAHKNMDYGYLIELWPSEGDNILLVYGDNQRAEYFQDVEFLRNYFKITFQKFFEVKHNE